MSKPILKVVVAEDETLFREFLVRIIRQRFSSVQVLALTSFKEEELVQNALQAGAIGDLLKDVTAEALAQAIRAAHGGRDSL